MLHLTDKKIDELVSFGDAIPVLEQAFRAFARGDAAVQKRVRTEASGVKLSTLGAVIPEMKVSGAKVYSTISGRFSFSIVLFSTEDGRLLATLDANAITRLRTAATTIVALKALGRSNARSGVVFGTGVQGRAHAHALAQFTGLKQLHIVGREGADALAHELNAAYGHDGLNACSSTADRAIIDADVIVTATRATGALFDGYCVKPGATIAAIGSSLATTRELDDVTLSSATRIVVEMREQAREEAGDLVQCAAGIVRWDEVVELGTVLNDSSLGRTSETDIVIYKAVGIGLQDIALAALAYRRAIS